MAGQWINSDCPDTMTTHIKVREKNSWILNHDLNGFDDGIPKHLRSTLVLLIILAFRFDILMASQLPQTLCSASENVVRGRLGVSEYENNEDWGSQPDDFPESPAPVFGLHCETRDDWADGGSPEAGCCPARQVNWKHQ